MQQNQQSSEPKPCLGGCGFFGNQTAFAGYCSKCYKAFAASATPSLRAAEAPKTLDALPASALGGSASAASVSSPAAPSSSSAATALTSLATSSSMTATPLPGIQPAEAPAPVAPRKEASNSGEDVKMSDATSLSSSSPASSPPAGASSLNSGAGACSSSSVRLFEVGPPTPAAPAVQQPPAAPVAPAPAVAEAAPALAAPAAGGDGGDDGKTQKNKSRCWGCKKKVGLTGFECRCGYVFCGTHRYADQHACGFDYKTHGRDLLAKANQKVVADKLEKV